MCRLPLGGANLGKGFLLLACFEAAQIYKFRRNVQCVFIIIIIRFLAAHTRSPDIYNIFIVNFKTARLKIEACFMFAVPLPVQSIFKTENFAKRALKISEVCF